MHYRLPKVIEALRNTTFHLHKCAKLDRPDPFIFQEAHKRVGYARLKTVMPKRRKGNATQPPPIKRRSTRSIFATLRSNHSNSSSNTATCRNFTADFETGTTPNGTSETPPQPPWWPQVLRLLVRAKHSHYLRGATLHQPPQNPRTRGPSLFEMSSINF